MSDTIICEFNTCCIIQWINRHVHIRFSEEVAIVGDDGVVCAPLILVPAPSAPGGESVQPLDVVLNLDLLLLVSGVQRLNIFCQSLNLEPLLLIRNRQGHQIIS